MQTTKLVSDLDLVEVLKKAEVGIDKVVALRMLETYLGTETLSELLQVMTAPISFNFAEGYRRAPTPTKSLLTSRLLTKCLAEQLTMSDDAYGSRPLVDELLTRTGEKPGKSQVEVPWDLVLMSTYLSTIPGARKDYINSSHWVELPQVKDTCRLTVSRTKVDLVLNLIGLKLRRKTVKVLDDKGVESSVAMDFLGHESTDDNINKLTEAHLTWLLMRQFDNAMKLKDEVLRASTYYLLTKADLHEEADDE